MTKILAKDCKCSRCGKQAVVFVGLADPDSPDYPMCRSHSEEWHHEILITMYLPEVLK